MQEMGGKAAEDGRQRYRRYEVDLQEMKDRDTGDGRYRAAEDGWRQRYRRWEVELQKMGNRDTEDGR
jgi:hypothetical protein